jgi:raffinose/stachyose/melibiose transport system permease protein
LELGAFLVPALVVYAAFVIVPVLMATYYSFFNWNGLEALDRFIGFDNYKRAFEDPVFRGAIQHNLTIAGLSVLLQLPGAFGLALLLNRRLPGRSALRLIIFAPYVLSEVITAVTWSLLLQPDGGVDHFMKAIGLGRFVQLWLGDPNIVLYTVFFVVTWKYIGFGIILLLAGLQGIPAELTEAASIDGASSWQVTRHITWPLLGPTVRIWIFLSIIGSLQLFDIVWIMTLGGPAGASETMAVYIVDQGFKGSQFGYGSAVAVILFIMCFVFALIYQRFVLRRDTEGALTRAVGG